MLNLFEKPQCLLLSVPGNRRVIGQEWRWSTALCQSRVLTDPYWLKSSFQSAQLRLRAPPFAQYTANLQLWCQYNCWSYLAHSLRVRPYHSILYAPAIGGSHKTLGDLTTLDFYVWNSRDMVQVPGSASPPSFRSPLDESAPVAMWWYVRLPKVLISNQIWKCSTPYLKMPSQIKRRIDERRPMFCISSRGRLRSNCWPGSI